MKADLELDSRLREAAARLSHSPIFVTVSGAHLYGFASHDSDYDLRAAHSLPLRELVGLRPPHETWEMSEVRDGLEWDIVSHEARKFAALLAKASGYALEQLFSPLVIQTSPAHEELKTILQSGLDRRFARHYRGFASGQWRLFQKEDPPRVKPLLYLYRVLLTGIRLLERGEIEANLLVLNEEFASSVVADLISRKVEGKEKEPLPSANLPFFAREYERLQERLSEAETNSILPPQRDLSGELNEWLVALRLGESATSGRGSVAERLSDEGSQCV